MLRIYLLISCFFYILVVKISFAQSKDINLESYSKALNKALVLRNTKMIKHLLLPTMVYTHSNGWTENRKELLRNLRRGLMRYVDIQSQDWNVAENGAMGTVKYNAYFKVIYQNKLQTFPLKVLQVWKKNKNKWRMASRISEPWPQDINKSEKNL